MRIILFKRFKLILNILFILIFTGMVTLQMINVNALSEQVYSFVKNSDKIKVLSRSSLTENGYEADFAGGGIAFSIHCQGQVKININFEGNPGMLGVVINDNFENSKSIKIDQPGVQDVVIAENLVENDYYFEVTKVNPQYINKVIFNSIVFNGQFNEKPEQRKFKLEFYGDSISCGVGSLSETIEDSGNPAGYEDNFLYSYNAYCARYLDAEISTCALPGYGYLYGYDEGKGQNVYPHMDKAVFSKNIEFDHSSFIADVVIIELGTNDVNYIKNHKVIAEDREVDEIVQQYIDKIRSYNEDCYIILMGCVSKGNFNLNEKVNGKYIKLDNAMIRGAAVNHKVLYLPELGMGISGRGWHPKADEAAAGGKALADFIINNIINCTEPPAIVDKADFYLNFDVNGDDRFTIGDVLTMQKYLANKSSKIDKQKADVDKDGSIDMKDAFILKKKLLNQNK